MTRRLAGARRDASPSPERAVVPRRRRGLFPLLGVVLAVLVAGCAAPVGERGAGATSGDHLPGSARLAASAAACRALADRPAAPAPTAATPTSSDRPAAAPPVSAAPPRATAGPEGDRRPGPAMPDVRLPCVEGAGTVRLAEVRGPAIINLWASWCGPCREELPAFQRYAQRTAGRVSVIGVNTADGAAGRTAVIVDLGLTFPILVDERAVLRAALGRAALPVTAFIDAAGRIAHVYNDVALDDAALDRLAAQHLGTVDG